jgi:hypothetical protein
MLSINRRIKEGIQFCLKDGLQPSENEVTPRRCVDEESKMKRDQIFGERVSVYPGEHCSLPNDSVGKGMDQSKQIASDRGCWRLISGQRDFRGSDERDPGLTRIVILSGESYQGMATTNQPVRYAHWIEPEE